MICNKLPENLKWNKLLPLPPALPKVSNSNSPTIKDVMTSYQSSQTEPPVEDNNYHTPAANSEVEENFTAQKSFKALPSSSSMVFLKSEYPESTTRSAASGTITQTRYVVKDYVDDKLEDNNQLEEIEQIELIEEIKDNNQLEKIEELEQPEQTSVSQSLAKLLPPARNHPPIEQFTPEKSDTSETFTSKLKAIVTEK